MTEKMLHFIYIVCCDILSCIKKGNELKITIVFTIKFFCFFYTSYHYQMYSRNKLIQRKSDTKHAILIRPVSDCALCTVLKANPLNRNNRFPIICKLSTT